MYINESKQIHSVKESHDYWPGAFDPAHADTARHHVMLSYALPIMKAFNAKNILTIGDNRARDAAYYKKELGIYSVASDLNSSKIKQAVIDGYVDEAVDIDVESISFEDDAFDFVLAKESFHHWPRPILGLYECLRVARLGIFLIEPFDGSSGTNQSYPSELCFHDSYEEVGNYKYQISLREMHKIAWSLRLPGVIAKGFNDPYTANLDLDRYLIEKSHLDELGQNNLRQFNLMMIFIAKQWPENQFSTWIDNTYNIRLRPINPWES